MPRDRTPLELIGFAAWLGVPPEEVPEKWKAHLCEDTMKRWEAVVNAVAEAIKEEPK